MLRLLSFLRSLLRREPVRLAIVRRYCDANGAYVGELYLEETRYMADGLPVRSYRMVGVSLDTLAYDPFVACREPWDLDTLNDFLAPVYPFTVRVGSLEPGDNDRVRRMVGSLPRRRMTLIVQNRFVEHVMEPRR